MSRWVNECMGVWVNEWMSNKEKVKSGIWDLGFRI